MLKLRPLLSSISPRMHYNTNKLYSKTAEKLEAVLNLPDALEAESARTTPNTTISNPSSMDGSPEVSKSGKCIGVKQKKGVRKSRCEIEKPKNCIQPKATKPPGPPGGYIMDKCDMYDIPRPNSKKWRKFSFVALPFVLGLSIFIMSSKEHPDPVFIPYEHLYRRTKRFAWRDGKTSLFHGPYNLIPEEEEERIDRALAKTKEKTPRYGRKFDEDENDFVVESDGKGEGGTEAKTETKIETTTPSTPTQTTPTTPTQTTPTTPTQTTPTPPAETTPTETPKTTTETESQQQNTTDESKEHKEGNVEGVQSESQQKS